MVHALRETHRVLRPGGSLVDMRPARDNRAVEVQLSGARLHIGEIDSSRSLDDHVAADAALRDAIAAGLFRAEHETQFVYRTALDTAADLREYAANLRRSVAPQELLDRADSLTQDESDSSIHIGRKIDIARVIAACDPLLCPCAEPFA